MDTTCVVTGLKYEFNENLLERCKDLLENGLKLDRIELANVVRTPMYEGKPGVVKMEFNSTNDKITVLQNKGRLKDNARFSRVFVRSSKSHEQRLLEKHTKELLGITGKGDDYYFNGSG